MNFPHFKLLTVLFLGGVIFFAAANSAKAEILKPDGAGNWSAWTGVFGDIDDYPTADEDSSHNNVSIAGARQSYSLSNTTKTVGTIRNVKVWARARAMDTPDSIKFFLRIGGNNHDALTSSTVTTSYADYFYQWDTNPQTATTWAIADLNSLEAGFQLVGGTSEHRVTMMYAQVEYDSEINTAKYHVLQKLTPLYPADGPFNQQFGFYIADNLDEIKSAYLEIKGIAVPYNPLYLYVSVDDVAMDPATSPRVRTYTINAQGRVMPLKMIYDTTDYFKTFVSGPGNYGRYLNLKVSGDAIYVLNAKLIITYSWVKPPDIVGAYRAYGDLTSSTFDTGLIGGAAFNSILWKSSAADPKPAGTRVKLQIAASNTNNPAPSDFIGGSACDSSSWWEPENNAAAEIKCYSQLNNKRYFRYKIRLCSSNDCTTSGNATPQIDDIVVNFSP